MDQQSTPLRGAETLALKAFQGAFPMNGGATNDFAARAARIAAVATAADAIWEGIEAQLEELGFSNAETGPLSMNLAYLMEQAEALAEEIAANG